MTRTLALVLVIALALVSCGDDTTETTGAAATTTETVSDTTATTDNSTTATEAPGAAAITIEGFSFGEPISVSVGSVVTVTNADGTAHTWSASDGSFDSGNIAGGDSFQFTFTEAGTFDFFCRIHPSMTGTVTVG